MNLADLRRRLDRIEACRHSPAFRGAVQIVTRNDADRDRQRAELEAAGRLGPGILLVDFRVVSPRWERSQ